ncbi:MAG: hypothetical protein ACXVCY_04280 [Pseudobdellovibrionaceae bacterium]
MKNKKPIKKAQYTGPMNAEDIAVESWNEFFREGGELNLPSWLENKRRDEIKKKFTFLARFHE